jgi:hypothetical protein
MNRDETLTGACAVDLAARPATPLSGVATYLVEEFAKSTPSMASSAPITKRAWRGPNADPKNRRNHAWEH